MIAAWGMKRIDDMSRDELIAALDAMHKRYMMLIRAKMKSSEVPVFHEDMDKWNEKLAHWFTPKEDLNGEERTQCRDLQAV